MVKSLMLRFENDAQIPTTVLWCG